MHGKRKNDIAKPDPISPVILSPSVEEEFKGGGGKRIKVIVDYYFASFFTVPPVYSVQYTFVESTADL